jgi:hypothetical protein
VLYRFDIDNPIADFTTLILEAVFRIPGVRFVLGLAAPEWRPLWALTWVMALVYVTMRIIESAQRVVVRRQLAAQASRGGPTVTRPIELVSRRSGTLDRAGGEFMDGTDDLAVVDAPTPKPSPILPPDEKRERHARATRAALVAGLIGCVLLILGTIGGDDPADAPSEGLVALPGAPPAASADDPAAVDGSGAEPPFAFAARSWRSAGGACVATLEVTAGSAAPRTLTMYVMDASGGILAKDQLRVASLTPKAFHEFRFPGIDCGAITEWQVQGVLGRR